MFERFTEAARLTVFLARAEAGGYGSRQIETEHFLLALLQESDSLLRRLLGDLATWEALENDVRQTLGIRDPIDKAVDLSLSHEVKRALAFGGEAAERLNELKVGTGHLLLGLLRENKCGAAKMLAKYGVTQERALDALDAGGVLPEGAPPPAGVVTRERLHELVDSLPEETWQHALGALIHLQVWPPVPSPEPARIAELREQMQQRMQAGRRPGSFSGGGGGISWSGGPGGQVQAGHYASSWVEDGVRVSETHLFLEGREITIRQRVRTTHDGSKVIISEQIRGPKGEQELSAEVDLI